jgi:hypothetical protein
MKNWIFVFLLLALPTSSAFANKLGAGFFIGEPTSLTMKYWTSSTQAVDAGLAFSLSDYFLIYADYLTHYPQMIPKKNQFLSQLEFYIGVGGLLVVTNKDYSKDDRYLGKKSGSVGFGVRVPVGVEWQPANPPLGIYLELVPGMSIIPKTDAFFQGGVGIRYYFP